MDISVLLIGLITISALVLPFIFSYRSEARNKKKLSALVNEKIASYGLSTSNLDILSDGVIGMDVRTYKIFYAAKDLSFIKIIDMNEIEKCRLKTTTRTVGEKSNSYTITEQIDIELQFVNRKEPAYLINFYDASKHFQLRGELQVAEKWYKTIEGELKEKVEFVNGSLV